MTVEEQKSAGLTGKVAAGAAWIVAARLVMRSLGFINTIILARLLAPADFGVVAIATAAMQLLQGVTDFGVSQAVIKFRSSGRAALDPLFTLSAIRGVVIAAFLFAIAGPAAQFYDDPRVFWVFAGISLYPLILGFLNPAFYEFERDLKLSKEFISNSINKLISVAVSIAVAVIFKNYWAIILGLSAGALVQLLLSYVLRPYLPRFTLRGVGDVLGFSGWLFGVSIVTALNNKLDMFIVARAVTPAETGLYSVGGQFAELPTTEIAAPIARAVYPGLSALQDQPQRMAPAFLKGVEALAVTCLPAAFGLTFVARDAVPLLLGDQWREAIPVVQFAGPVLGFQCIFIATYYYALALGRARLIFMREVLYFVLRLPPFAWAVFAHGLMGAIVAGGLLGFIRVGLNLAVYAQASGRPFWEPLWRARRPIGAVAAMSLYFLLLRPQFDLPDSQPLIRLAADIIAGGAVYCAALLGLWRAEGGPDGVESLLVRTLRRIRRKSPA
ncbi:MAG: lipopolysaccharide biosynthesis protein [Parvularculaceae bacterium]|nr:lipopolysaccharide biosynthesis protein [Parvularculaceae bacterium]